MGGLIEPIAGPRVGGGKAKWKGGAEVFALDSVEAVPVFIHPGEVNPLCGGRGQPGSTRSFSVPPVSNVAKMKDGRLDWFG